MSPQDQTLGLVTSFCEALFKTSPGDGRGLFFTV